MECGNAFTCGHLYFWVGVVYCRDERGPYVIRASNCRIDNITIKIPILYNIYIIL